jgi:membrane protein insertase Oxa1/YidC/SpoIIIJ
MEWWHVVLYVLGGLLAIVIGWSAIKLIFWTIPNNLLGAKSWPDYLIKTAIAALTLIGLFVISFFYNKLDDSSAFITILVVLLLIVALMFLSSRMSSNRQEED